MSVLLIDTTVPKGLFINYSNRNSAVITVPSQNLSSTAPVACLDLPSDLTDGPA